VPADVRAATGNGVAALGVWVTGRRSPLRRVLLAELATQCESGGEYQYLSHVYGRPWDSSALDHLLRRFRRAYRRSALKAVEYFRLSRRLESERAVDWRTRRHAGFSRRRAIALLFALAHSIGVRPSDGCK